MKLLIVSRIDNEGALEYARRIAGTLEDMGHSVWMEMGTAQKLGVDGVSTGDVHPDTVVVIGGDGSVLRTVQQLRHQVPVLGINWGEVGFLTVWEPEEALSYFSAPERYSIEARMRITLILDERPIGSALNEALIITSRPSKMLRFAISIDGAVTERFRADGMLVSTPTGSTAYAMSAGGPIIDPRIEGYLLVPLAPYMLSSRPHLVDTDRSVEIALESSKTAKVVLDGQKTCRIGRYSRIRVHKAEEPAYFINPGKNFFERVDHKLRSL
ncbi:MAG: NAD(+)/NADH kinase [Methanoculleaceae archaeon]